MTGFEESSEVHDHKRGYFLSASLVNRLIVSIIFAIISIGGYMIIWAINDSQFKSVQETKLDILTQQVQLLHTKVNSGILPIAESEIRRIDQHLQRLEREKDSIEGRLQDHLENGKEGPHR